MLELDTLSVTVVTANTYHTRQGNAAWDGEDAAKESALWRGQSYIAGKYNNRWLVAFEADDAPVAVQYSIAEAGLLELATPGTLAPTLERGGQVTRLRERVEGAVEVETEWASGAPAETKILAIENLLIGAGLITSGMTLSGLVARA